MKATIEAMLVQVAMGLGERLAHSSEARALPPAVWRVQVHALAVRMLAAGVDVDDPDSDVFMALVDALARTGNWEEALAEAGVKS